MHDGPSAAWTAAPIFLVLTGLWMGLASLFALHFARRQRLTPNGVYGFAAVSSLLAAALFFVLFVYFLMFCLPVSFQDHRTGSHRVS